MSAIVLFLLQVTPVEKADSVTGTAALPQLHLGCINVHLMVQVLSAGAQTCVSNSPRVNAIYDLTASSLRAPNGNLL